MKEKNNSFVFFTGLSSLVEACKYWRVSVVILLFTIIGIKLFQQPVLQETLTQAILTIVATSFIIALGVTIGIYTILKMDLIQSQPRNELLSRASLFNQSIWSAFKEMYFLGKPLFIFWVGITIILLASNIVEFVVIRSILMVIFLVYLFPLASFMINKRITGSLDKSYKGFSKFILVNLLSTIISYFFAFLISVVFIVFLVTLALSNEQQNLAFAFNFILIPIFVTIYFVYLQVAFQQIYNQTLVISTKNYE
ncbi:hypothetical protein [Psittacicella gerlachiana]|uniref:Uncharacterized protein n=1 Tax=Psittacicella gerlachiana TaxID=2028574 RepID=A0A3A1YGB6_9GAMM|nr:hypothetical protein [Psittacicella gerlachiana]RIY35254.1 hypothetical protein CKF59_03840 [Psittacicella gerlachiana]